MTDHGSRNKRLRSESTISMTNNKANNSVVAIYPSHAEAEAAVHPAIARHAPRSTRAGEAGGRSAEWKAGHDHAVKRQLN
jgi:hypothetical protein